MPTPTISKSPMLPPWKRPGAMGFFPEDGEMEKSQEVSAGVERVSPSIRVESSKSPMSSAGSLRNFGALGGVLSSEAGSVARKVMKSTPGFFKEVFSSVLDLKNAVNADTGSHNKKDQKPDSKAETKKKEAGLQSSFRAQNETNQGIAQLSVQKEQDHLMKIAGISSRAEVAVAAKHTNTSYRVSRISAIDAFSISRERSTKVEAAKNASTGPAGKGSIYGADMARHNENQNMGGAG